MARPLTPKQSAFVREYLIDLNATAAYKRAGYIAKGNAAEVNATRLLRNAQVQAEIQVAMNQRSERIEITADRVLKEIARLAFFDPRRLLNGDGTPKAIHELDDDTAAAVAGIDIVTKGNEDLGYADILKIKLADKSKNLETQEPMACVACEGNPKGENIPCAVCGATPPAAPVQEQDSAKRSADSAESFCNQEIQDLTSLGARLALELECLLLECKDTAAVSKWWDTAHEALADWHDYLWQVSHGDNHVSPLGKD